MGCCGGFHTSTLRPDSLAARASLAPGLRKRPMAGLGASLCLLLSWTSDGPALPRGDSLGLALAQLPHTLCCE
jgi:hypothetical protein